MRIKDGDLMTAADAAAVLGLSIGMVTKLRRLGRLPAARTPSGWYFFLTRDVMRLAKQRAKAPRQGGRVTRGFVRVAPPGLSR